MVRSGPFDREEAVSGRHIGYTMKEESSLYMGAAPRYSFQRALRAGALGRYSILIVSLA
jgi:hypothetical protein